MNGTSTTPHRKPFCFQSKLQALRIFSGTTRRLTQSQQTCWAGPPSRVQELGHYKAGVASYKLLLCDIFSDHGSTPLYIGPESKTSTLLMGLLYLGTPLTWAEAKKYADHVRHHGITQFLHIWDRLKDRTGDELLWGDEVRT
jgi:hypothetical protein